MRDLVIIGAGGFGRETIDIVRAIGDACPWRLRGVVDDCPSPVNIARLERLNVQYLGGIEDTPQGAAVAIAVGNPHARRTIADKLGDDHEFATLAHPSAVIGSDFSHGEGLVILNGASIGTNVSVGDHVHLNAHAVVGHDSRLGNYVSVNPNATISGECLINDESLFGASSTILQGLSVEPGTTIGAGAVVIQTLTATGTYVGIPATKVERGATGTRPREAK